MTASKRWQDYATIVLGALLLISPFVFGATAHARSSIGAWVLGVLLMVGGIVAAMTREPRRSPVVNAPGIAASSRSSAGSSSPLWACRRLEPQPL